MIQVEMRICRFCGDKFIYWDEHSTALSEAKSLINFEHEFIHHTSQCLLLKSIELHEEARAIINENK